MKDKKLLILGGIGGNLKSTILSHSSEISNLARIPECNSEFDKFIGDYDEKSSVVKNLAVKKLVMSTLIDSQLHEFISDRTLIDYAIMNEMISRELTHYSESANKMLDFNSVLSIEREVTRLCKVYPVLLLTTDKEFLSDIIDNSFSERAIFYDNSDSYLVCQEIYKNRFLSAYSESLVIEVSNAKDTIANLDQLISKIKDFYNDIR